MYKFSADKPVSVLQVSRGGLQDCAEAAPSGGVDWGPPGAPKGREPEAGEAEAAQRGRCWQKPRAGVAGVDRAVLGGTEGSQSLGSGIGQVPGASPRRRMRRWVRVLRLKKSAPVEGRMAPAPKGSCARAAVSQAILTGNES